MTTELYGVEDLPDTGLSSVAESARALSLAYAEKERLEAEAKLNSERIRRIECDELPAAMRQLGVEKITLTNGEIVSVRKEVSAQISEAHRDAAHAWLRETGNDSLIKRVLLVSFGRGEDDIAANLVDQLRERYPDNELVDKAAVHAGTLKAFIKERIEMEENSEFEIRQPLPRELFGVFIVNRAIVKKPKGED